MATLIIAEKPKSAVRIASALSDGDYEKETKRKAPWYECEINGEQVYVVPAVGHLYTLTQEGKGFDYPVFDVKWVPTFENDKSASYAKPYYQNLQKIAEQCNTFVVSTDYDTEGEIIAYNILRFIAGQTDAKRMKFSTLATSDLQTAYQQVMEHLDMGQVNAGLLRHYLDWYWGINTSRALMAAVKKNNRFSILSIGRVQGPTLGILAEREREIQAFEPEPYWQLFLTSGELEAIYETKRLFDKADADRVYQECDGHNGAVRSVQTKQRTVKPPTPFNLTDLQKEASRVLNMSPSQTLRAAQNLYLAGLISYPRTSSQKLPPSIGYQQIIEHLETSCGYQKQVQLLPPKKQRKPREGKKNDPAHPAIYPTGQQPGKLQQQEKKLYDLVVKRFLATFGTACKREKMTITIGVNGHAFIAEGMRTVTPGWTAIYAPYARMKETELPQMEEGQTVTVDSLEQVEKETQPPKRYTPSSLISELEKRDLGTKATRSDVVDSLYSRQYIRNVPIEVTELGLEVVKTVQTYSPEVVSEELTRTFEHEMDEVMRQQKDKDTVLAEARETLTKIMQAFKDNEAEIGEQIVGALDTTRRNERYVGECPSCGHELRIITSKKSGKRFIGCSNYSNGCKTSFPLPQKGLAKTSDKTCKECGYPIVQIIRKGKRPWDLCISTDCPSKEEWRQKQQKNGKQGSNSQSQQKQQSQQSS